MVFISISAYSQCISSILDNDSHKLSANADVVGFLKNNEYFSPMVKGETFHGVRICPTVAYQLGVYFKA